MSLDRSRARATIEIREACFRELRQRLVREIYCAFRRFPIPPPPKQVMPRIAPAAIIARRCRSRRWRASAGCRKSRCRWRPRRTRRSVCRCSAPTDKTCSWSARPRRSAASLEPARFRLALPTLICLRLRVTLVSSLGDAHNRILGFVPVKKRVSPAMLALGLGCRHCREILAGLLLLAAIRPANAGEPSAKRRSVDALRNGDP